MQLTLQELADAQLLAAPLDEVAPVSRRDLLRRGVAAAAIPAIYSIVAPPSAAAQSVPTGTASFAFTGAPETFVVPGGVVAITIVATGGAGANGAERSLLFDGGAGGPGGGRRPRWPSRRAHHSRCVSGVRLNRCRRFQRRRWKHGRRGRGRGGLGRGWRHAVGDRRRRRGRG